MRVVANYRDRETTVGRYEGRLRSVGGERVGRGDMNSKVRGLLERGGGKGRMHRKGDSRRGGSTRTSWESMPVCWSWG